MGEIGIPRHEFLHVLRWWEIRSIIRGYGRRHRHLWSIARWQTYNLMCCLADIKKAGISRPTDLIEFPWDNHGQSNILSDEEVEELANEIDSYNKNPQQK